MRNRNIVWDGRSDFADDILPANAAKKLIKSRVAVYALQLDS